MNFINNNPVTKDKSEKKWEKDQSHLWEELKHAEAILVVKDDIKEKEIINEFFNENFNKIKAKLNKSINYDPCFFRGLILIIDFNDVIDLRDFSYKPNKLSFLKNYLKIFANKFFERNLISTLSVIGVKDYIAKAIVISSFDEKIFISDIEKNWPKEGSGKFSFYNSIYFCSEFITLIEERKEEKLHNYELAFIINSEDTYDSHSCLDHLTNFYVNLGIQINIFSFMYLPEMFIKAATITGGVALNKDLDLFFNFLCYKEFNPTRQFLNRNKIAINIIEPKEVDNLCYCHNYLVNFCYECPDDKTTYCFLPIACTFCNSILTSQTYYSLLKSFIQNNSYKFLNKKEKIKRSSNFIKISTIKEELLLKKTGGNFSVEGVNFDFSLLEKFLSNYNFSKIKEILDEREKNLDLLLLYFLIYFSSKIQESSVFKLDGKIYSFLSNEEVDCYGCEKSFKLKGIMLLCVYCYSFYCDICSDSFSQMELICVICGN